MEETKGSEEKKPTIEKSTERRIGHPSPRGPQTEGTKGSEEKKPTIEKSTERRIGHPNPP